MKKLVTMVLCASLMAITPAVQAKGLLKKIIIVSAIGYGAHAIAKNQQQKNQQTPQQPQYPNHQVYPQEPQYQTYPRADGQYVPVSPSYAPYEQNRYR